MLMMIVISVSCPVTVEMVPARGSARCLLQVCKQAQAVETWQMLPVMPFPHLSSLSHCDAILLLFYESFSSNLRKHNDMYYEGKDCHILNQARWIQAGSKYVSCMFHCLFFSDSLFRGVRDEDADQKAPGDTSDSSVTWRGNVNVRQGLGSSALL